MWENIGRMLAGLIEGLSERYRVAKGRRKKYTALPCPKCGYLVPSVWNEDNIPGYQWVVPKCLNCGWSAWS